MSDTWCGLTQCPLNPVNTTHGTVPPYVGVPLHGNWPPAQTPEVPWIWCLPMIILAGMMIYYWWMCRANR